jgi:hypothetical protein
MCSSKVKVDWSTIVRMLVVDMFSAVDAARADPPTDSEGTRKPSIVFHNTSRWKQVRNSILAKVNPLMNDDYLLLL